MARDTGSYTTSNLPVTDPLHTLPVSAASADNTTTLSYTTTGVHNLKVGSPVVIYGTGSASFNFNPDSYAYGNTAPSATILGFGTPAVVSAVTGTNTFQVKAPSVVATASVATGTVVNDTLDSNAPWDKTWLPSSAQTNVVIAREWGNSFPIQNNEDRAANVAITGVSANGSQITFTVGSGHGLVAGQRVSIQGVKSGSYNSDAYNFENVIASTSATTVVFNSTLTDAVTSYANGAIVSQAVIGGAKVISSAVGAVAYAGSTSTTTSTTAAAATSVGVNSTSGLVVGMGVSATVATVLSGTVITAIGSGTITVNPALSTSVASAAVLTFSASTSNQYVTQQAHGLSTGQNIAIAGASNGNYNISGIATVVDTKTVAINVPSFKVLKVTKSDGTGVVGDGTNVTYYTDSAHGLAINDKVTITGMAPAGYNVVNGSVITSPAPTANSFTIANTTTTAVTAAGQVVKNSGTFTGTAIVAGDKAWASTYAYPSGQLDPSLDNHDRVANSERGYPDFTPTYTTPNIIGLTTTNAIQKIRAAGQTTGFIQFSSDITATTVATTTTTLTVTSGTAHNLSVGDTVNLSGSSNTTLNIGDAVVSALPSTVGFTVLASGCTGTVGATALVFRPKNTVVSAQSPAAGATTATVVGFTRNYGI
jgi:hypothetical protein